MWADFRFRQLYHVPSEEVRPLLQRPVRFLRASRGVTMTSQAVKIQVIASVPIECEFWPEDDGWKGLSRSPSATVRGSSFEDAKKNMASELQAQIEAILREHPQKSPRRIAWATFYRVLGNITSFVLLWVSITRLSEVSSLDQRPFRN